MSADPARPPAADVSGGSGRTCTTVALLGSTGSIGTQTLDVIRQLPGRYRVVALSAGRSVELLAAQARELRPDVVVVGDAAAAADVAHRLPAGIVSS